MGDLQGKSSKKPDIAVIGVGGAGNNAIHRLSALGPDGLRPMVMNTDKMHIEIVDCPTKILIGEDLTHGLGAAGCPEIGEECAQKATKELSNIIGNPDILFIVAGMGGGTGTGASVVVARIGRDNGAFVVAVVSMPFSVEGKRKAVAERGLERLRRDANCVIVIDNDRLIDIGGDMPIEDAFSIVDHLISGLIDNISRNITLPNKIKQEVPIEAASTREAPQITIEDIQDLGGEVDHHGATLMEPPPLVTVDIGGMAEFVKSEEPRSLQGLKMAEHVVNEMKMPDLPKRSNVLITETRPLTLLPFLMAEENNLGNEDARRIFQRAAEQRKKGFKGGRIMRKVKEKEEKDDTKTSRPMTQTKLDHLWV